MDTVGAPAALAAAAEAAAPAADAAACAIDCRVEVLKRNAEPAMQGDCCHVILLAESDHTAYRAAYKHSHLQPLDVNYAGEPS